jgi:hypothetical protein
LVAGALCLDFAKTVEWHASANPEERLRAHGDFVAWSRRAELLTDAQAARILRKARQRSRPQPLFIRSSWCAS